MQSSPFPVSDPAGLWSCQRLILQSYDPARAMMLETLLLQSNDPAQRLIPPELIAPWEVSPGRALPC